MRTLGLAHTFQALFLASLGLGLMIVVTEGSPSLSRRTSRSSSSSITSTHSTMRSLSKMTIDNGAHDLIQFMKEPINFQVVKAIKYLKGPDSDYRAISHVPFDISPSFNFLNNNKKTKEDKAYINACYEIIPTEIKHKEFAGKKPNYQSFCRFTLKRMYAEIQVWNEEIKDVQILQEKYPTVKSIVSSISAKRIKTTIMGRKEKFDGMDKNAAEKAFRLIWDLILIARCVEIFIEGMKKYWDESNLVYSSPLPKDPSSSKQIKERLGKMISGEGRKEKKKMEEEIMEMKRIVRKEKQEMIRKLGEDYPLFYGHLRTLDHFITPFYSLRAQDISFQDYFRGVFRSPDQKVVDFLKRHKMNWDEKKLYLTYLQNLIQFYPDDTREEILSGLVTLPSWLTITLARLSLLTMREFEGGLEFFIKTAYRQMPFFQDW
ncbi:MAG: hypothetical protein DHS80DRAFT_24425 [Piptocephalis tieghemiana]|nr:MAG: hypothetical protein DHS80DRAFT_24425 [Piptocephalis tieghemiana]